MKVPSEYHEALEKYIKEIDSIEMVFIDHQEVILKLIIFNLC